MPVANVKTRWVDGDLVFYDKAGNEIFRVDGTNRKMVFPAGSVLDLDAAAGILLPAAAEIATADLADGAVTAGKVEADLLRYADVQLTNAQILALRATPITLVGAPGANRAILVHAVYFVLDAAAGAYTETADNLAVEYASGADVLTIETTGLVDQAAVSLGRAAPAVALTVPAVVANSAVRLFNSGDGEFGGGNAANTLSVRTYYSVVDTVAFA